MNDVAVRLLLFAVALPALPSCGASLTPIDVQPGCPEQPMRGPEQFASAPIDRLIDDFEDGDLLLPRVSGRTGSWLSVPAPSATLTGEASNRCAARGTQAGHFTALGYPDYGVSWSAVLVATSGPAIANDASAYSGISFWIATGDNALPPLETPFGVVTTDVAPNGGICTVCLDYYAIRFPLTKTWTRHVIPFADLHQNGFGVPQVSLRADRLVSLIFWPAHQFDIWIDDIRFEP
jgi:hypothetical protein